MCMWMNSQTIENLLSRDVIHLKGMVIKVNEIQNIFDQSIIQYVGDIQELQTRRETPPVESQFKVAVQEGKIKTPNSCMQSEKLTSESCVVQKTKQLNDFVS